MKNKIMGSTNFFVNKLLIEIQNGNMKALEKLFDNINGKLVFFAKQYLIDKSFKNDVINDTIVCVLKYISTFNAEFNGLNWIIKILRNNALKYNKQCSTLNQESTENIDLFDVVDCEKLIEDRIAINDILIELKEDEKKYFYYYFIQEYSVREIAILEGISKSNIARKIKNLKEKIIFMLEMGQNVKI